MTEELLRDDFEAQVIHRAWSDPEFKDRLMADPKAALKAEFGQSVSDELEIVVVDESQGRFGLVIPPKPTAANKAAELSEEQLESVAGGGRTAPLSKLTLSSWRSQMSLGKTLAYNRAYADTWVPVTGTPASGRGLAARATAYCDTWVP